MNWILGAIVVIAMTALNCSKTNVVEEPSMTRNQKTKSIQNKYYPFHKKSQEEFGFSSKASYVKDTLLKKFNTEAAITGPSVVYPICFEFEDDVPPKNIQDMLDIMNTSVASWIEPIKDQWEIEELVFQIIEKKFGRCPSYDPKTKQERADINQWAPTLRIYSDYEAQYNYSIISLHRIYFKKDVIQDPYKFEVLIMHELGHILGLGDTYSREGLQNPTNSVAGIMNTSFLGQKPVLQQDDIDGIRHVWQSAINGTYHTKACPEGYTESPPEENMNNLRFCVRPDDLSGPNDIHPECSSWVALKLCDDENQPQVRTQYCPKSCAKWDAKNNQEDIKQTRRRRRERPEDVSRVRRSRREREARQQRVRLNREKNRNE